ncbi:MAG: hypothetical protein WD648_10710 [Planctomycetaceae bacterium]
MNSLTAMQRKLVYFFGILVLMIPTMLLGLPAGSEGGGGVIAQKRAEYDLGESNLGQVDPSSATMNLVLLGFRGVAANLLWLDALDQQEKKNWSQLKSNVESIILLQPHYLQVWRHQGWNLAYNVSAEWDGVADRYYWVKEGAKFLIRGHYRNQIYPDLPHDVGTTLGKKIGRADEWLQFRRYFIDKDPDEQKYGGGPDNELNRDGLDNYLVARDWYEIANEKEMLRRNTIMARVLFRQYPSRSLMDYPDALQREGTFGELSEQGWQEAHRTWVNEYGREPYPFQFGEVFLEATPEEIDAMAKEYGVDANLVSKAVESLRSTANYGYWKTRSRIEATPEMVKAHRSLYEGQRLYREGKYGDVEVDGKVQPSEAETLTLEGLTLFEGLFQEHSELLDVYDTVDEVLMGIICLNYIAQVNNHPAPESFPLKSLWLQQQIRIPNLNTVFRSENRIRE